MYIDGASAGLALQTARRLAGGRIDAGQPFEDRSEGATQRVPFITGGKENGLLRKETKTEMCQPKAFQHGRSHWTISAGAVKAAETP